jgi:hypothetical protein
MRSRIRFMVEVLLCVVLSVAMAYATRSGAYIGGRYAAQTVGNTCSANNWGDMVFVIPTYGGGNPTTLNRWMVCASTTQGTLTGGKVAGFGFRPLALQSNIQP